MSSTARKTPDDKVTPLKLTVKGPLKAPVSGKASKENLLQVWEKLVDLHIFNDDVKQERLRSFMLIEAIIMIGFTMTLTQLFATGSIGGELVFIVLGFTLCIMGFVLARRTESMDQRNGHYVRTIKNQLRHVEAQLKPMLTGIDMLPYEGQFKVLNQHSLQLDPTGHYTELSPKARKTSARRLAQQAATHHERLVIRACAYAWMAAFVCMVVTATFMLTPSLHLGMDHLSARMIHH